MDFLQSNTDLLSVYANYLLTNSMIEVDDINKFIPAMIKHLAGKEMKIKIEQLKLEQLEKQVAMMKSRLTSPLTQCEISLMTIKPIDSEMFKQFQVFRDIKTHELNREIKAVALTLVMDWLYKAQVCQKEGEQKSLVCTNNKN